MLNGPPQLLPMTLGSLDLPPFPLDKLEFPLSLWLLLALATLPDLPLGFLDGVCYTLNTFRINSPDIITGRTTDSSNAISSELRFVDVPVITNAVCQASYGSIVQAQHICTSGAGGRGSCNGDSGGPLVLNGVEIGIVSFGATSCQAGHPSAFARVSTFRAWITSNAGV